jgi:hypothetical protein
LLAAPYCCWCWPHRTGLTNESLYVIVSRKQWYLDANRKAPRKVMAHTALSDIRV